jgi:peptidylamidoglycolate lyase
MIIKKIAFVIFLLIAILFFCYYLQPLKTGKGIDKKTKFEIVNNWPQLPDSFILGNPAGIAVDSNQNLVVFYRGKRKWPLISFMPETYISSKTILILDQNSGKIIANWGENLFIMPHGLTVDKDNNIWVTDVGLHQVFKFTNDGKLLLKLGEAKISGNDSLHFNRPTDIAVAPDGCFYVSDGYGNSRVIKFSSSGKYLFEWGTKGSKEGQFDIPHAIDLDQRGNVYVADRENSRIQIFDSTGKFLKQFANKNFGAICSVVYDKSANKLVAVDDVSFLKLKHRGSDVLIFDLTGKVQTRFGRSGFYDGSTCWYHDVAVDKEGTVYVADILKNRIQKFRRVN